MKAVTPSVALVVLAAFAGLPLPCFSFESAYTKLDTYLKTHALADTLEASIVAVEDIEETENQEDNNDLFELASALRGLKDGGDGELCSGDSLENLCILVEAALNYDENSPNPHTNANRLNNLLVDLKAKVHAKCYRFIKSNWLSKRESWEDCYRRPSTEIKYIDKKIRNKHDLFIRLIQRHRDTTEPFIRLDDLTIENTLLNSLLDGDGKNICLGMPLSQFRDRVYLRLINPCSNIMSNEIGLQTAKPMRELLALEMMDFPEGESVPEDRSHLKLIHPLPAYLICEWLDSKSEDEHEGMISRIHRILIRASRGLDLSSLQVRV